MRLYRLVGVHRSRFGRFREHGIVLLVYAKHARHARRLAAEARPVKAGEENPFRHPSLTRCCPVLHARCRGIRAGVMRG